MIEAETQVKDIHDIIFKVREMSADEKNSPSGRDA